MIAEGSPALQIVSLPAATAPASNEEHGTTNVLRHEFAHCGVPHAGLFPLAIGVMKTAKALPWFTLPAALGSKVNPVPFKLVPEIFTEVLFVFQPCGMVPPDGQAPLLVSLKYQRYWYAPEPAGLLLKVMAAGLPDPQNV